MFRPPPWLRVVLLAAILIAIAVALVFRTRAHPEFFTAIVSDYPAAMPLIFVLLHIAGSLVFVPRGVMALAAGALFGALWGGVWSMTGAMAGAMSGFALARYVNADVVHVEDIPRFGAFIRRVELGGWRLVMVTRLLPVLPHALVNYVYGLSRLSAGDYAAGSFLGFLPQTIALVQLGNAGAAAASGGAWVQTMLWAMGLVGVSLVLPKLLPQRWRQ